MARYQDVLEACLSSLKPRLTRARATTRGMKLGVTVCLLLLAACSSGDDGTASAKAPGAAPPALAKAAPAATSAQPLPDAPRVNGERAMQYVREVVDFGPRPDGSAAHEKLQAYLREQLRGIDLEEDAFTASTPVGRFPMRNLIAKFPGSKDGVIVISGHYDTNYPLKNFVGANDGGSSTGLLLELAKVLRDQPRDGYSVWLVWFDGEEAFQQWSDTDSLYGSRHLAEKWERDGTLKKIRAFLLLDMIGDADLNVLRDMNSTPWLLDVVHNAAARLGNQSYFFQSENEIADDHLPFARRGVPVADLIDLSYGPNNTWHHTLNDTLDKVSPKSLEIVGNTVLETIRLLDSPAR
jgi:Peptidase family M28